MWGNYREPWREVVALTLDLALESGFGRLKHTLNSRIGFVEGATVRVYRREYDGQLIAERDGEEVEIDIYDLM